MHPYLWALSSSISFQSLMPQCYGIAILWAFHGCLPSPNFVRDYSSTWNILSHIPCFPFTFNIHVKVYLFDLVLTNSLAKLGLVSLSDVVTFILVLVFYMRYIVHFVIGLRILYSVFFSFFN